MSRLNYSILIISFLSLLLTACSGTAITQKEVPTYEINESETSDVLKSEFFDSILKTDEDSGKIVKQSETIAIENSQNPESEKANENRTVVKVHSVIDADTIKFIDPETNKVSVARLIGINAPEYKK